MIVIVLVVSLIVAYLWLAGHWFGRALAFVAFSAVFSIVAVAILEGTSAALPVMLATWVAAWYLARLPWVYWTRRAREGWEVVG